MISVGSILTWCLLLSIAPLCVLCLLLPELIDVLVSIIISRCGRKVVGDEAVDDVGFTVNIVVVAVKFDGRKSQLFVTKPAAILVIARLLNISSWSLSCGLLESLSLGKVKSVLDYTKCLCEIRNSVEPYLRRWEDRTGKSSCCLWIAAVGSYSSTIRITGEKQQDINNQYNW